MRRKYNSPSLRLSDVEPASLPIEPELSWTGAAICGSITNRITQRMIDLVATEMGQNLMTAFPTLNVFEDEDELKLLLTRMKECDALVDVSQIIKVYAANPAVAADF